MVLIRDLGNGFSYSLGIPSNDYLRACARGSYDGVEEKTLVGRRGGRRVYKRGQSDAEEPVLVHSVLQGGLVYPLGQRGVWWGMYV